MIQQISIPEETIGYRMAILCNKSDCIDTGGKKDSHWH